MEREREREREERSAVQGCKSAFGNLGDRQVSVEKVGVVSGEEAVRVQLGFGWQV